MISRVVRVCVCCLVAAGAAAAQEAVNFASVGGRVIDPSLAVVPVAVVTARQVETNVTAETRTGADGRFRFAYLKVGRYEITVHLAGFADATRALTLTVGGAYDVPIALAVENVSADVTVAADAAIVEAARSQIAATVTQAEADALPMRGRNFLDLALLVPGVAPTNVASTQLFAETSAVPGAGLSIGSQRNFSNNFIVDGLSANDDAAGLSGMPYGVDSVDQFQVVTSGGQAELGRALGGYVNVVTKSGTNTPHGDAYEFFRDDALNAANPLVGEALAMHQNQFGASAGGPLIQDRTFYFANLERRVLDQAGLVTILPAAVLAINAKLATSGYHGPPIATGEYPNPIDATTWFGKLDHQLSAGDQLAIRYSQYGVASQNSRGAGGLNAETASAALDNVDRSVAVSNTMSLSSKTVNETRAQVVWSDLKAPPSDSVGPAVSIAGVASFGTLSGSPTRRQNTLYEIVDTVSHQSGAHALRGGVDVLFNDDTITYPRAVRGSYTFSSLANFLAGVYNNAGFTQTFGDSVVAQTNPNVGVFAQDEWKLRANLTVNAGMRYDLQFLETIRTDTSNVAPRIGVAWTPWSARELVVRGSAGLFYDRVPLRALANALLSAGNTTDVAALRQVGIGLSPGQAGAPSFPNVLASPIASVTLPTLTTMDPAMRNAYSRQAAFEIEQRVGDRTTVSAGYQYVRGVGLIVALNQNVPSCVASGSNNGCRPASAYGNNSQYSPLASSAYHGLHLSLVQRPTKWGAYRVTYTLSKAMDDVGEFFFSQPIDPFDLSKDWGRSDDDQRHRLVVNGNVNVLTLQLSGTLQYYSALPLNITSGVTTIQATAGRPLAGGAPSSSLAPPDAHTSTFIPRNSGEGPDFFTINLRVSRMFSIGPRARLEALAEMFNLTNRINPVTLQSNFGGGSYPTAPSSNFGTMTAVGDPRAVQFAIKARF